MTTMHFLVRSTTRVDGIPNTAQMNATHDTARDGWIFRAPEATDAHAIYRLITRCPPLDGNSLYCYLLQCAHFSGTCMLAERAGEVRGWISSYIQPAHPSRLFIWQIAVDSDTRGSGLARRLALTLLERETCKRVRFIDATVTPGNAASRALFASLAHHLATSLTTAPYFECERHFGGVHESEELITIGPIDAARLEAKYP
jgi:L-2,4-diaminobutyric acid acetyltransferase